MPWGDRTGPFGYGPMSGRAAGYCAGFGAPGYVSMGPRRGRRQGWGRGMWQHPGWGRFPYASPYQYYGEPAVMMGPTAAEEKMYLREQTKILEEELKMLKSRLEEIEDARED